MDVAFALTPPMVTSFKKTTMNVTTFHFEEYFVHVLIPRSTGKIDPLQFWRPLRTNLYVMKKIVYDRDTMVRSVVL